MNTSFICSLACLFFTISITAQKNQSPVGIWTFNGVVDRAAIDPIALSQLNDGAIDELIVDLKNNGTYVAHVLGKKISGKWKLKKNLLKLKSFKKPVQFNVFVSTENELGLELTEGGLL